MNRHVFQALIKICGKSILLTTFVGIVIGIVGYLNKWNTALAYSNAFFIAGCLVIIAGTASRFTANQDGNNTRLFYAESFRNMNNIERANFIVEASSSLSALILGVVSGIFLVIISVLIMKLSL